MAFGWGCQAALSGVNRRNLPPADRGAGRATETSADINPGNSGGALIAGQSLQTSDVLSSVLATLRPGQTVPVQIVRSSTGQQATVQVTLGSQPGK